MFFLLDATKIARVYAYGESSLCASVSLYLQYCVVIRSNSLLRQYILQVSWC